MCNAVWDIYVIQSENFYHYRLWSLSHSCHTHPSSFPTFMSFRFLLWSAEFNPAVCENNVLAPGGLTSPSWSFFQSFLFIIFHDRLSLSYWGWSWTCSSPALPSQVGEITCIIRIIRSNLWDFSLLPGILSWQRGFFCHCVCINTETHQLFIPFCFCIHPYACLENHDDVNMSNLSLSPCGWLYSSSV